MDVLYYYVCKVIQHDIRLSRIAKQVMYRLILCSSDSPTSLVALQSEEFPISFTFSRDEYPGVFPNYIGYRVQNASCALAFCAVAHVLRERASVAIFKKSI